MRRLTLACVVAPVAVWLSNGGVASAAPTSCQQYDSHGICIVQAETPGSPASTTQPASTGSTGGGAVLVCTVTSTGSVVPCDGDMGYWSQAMQCYVQPWISEPPKDSPIWGGHTDGAIYFCSSYTGGRMFPGTNGYPFWAAAPPVGPVAVDPAVLAQQALDSLMIPAPTTGRYPAGTLQDGQPYTVVNAYTWYWTDPALFRVRTARADAGAVWAQVTVTPTALTFSPGDGEAAVSCSGPGTPWQASDGVWSPSPAGCDYRYPHSSLHQPDGEVTAVYGIQWTITWTSSTGASGTLPALTTTSPSTFAVAEVQALVTR